MKASRIPLRKHLAIASCGLLALGAAAEIHAQSASMLGPPGVRAPLTLSNSSWCYQALEPPKQIQINDIITVIVSEKSQFAAEGEVDGRKRANYDARLQDWIMLKNWDLKPAPQSDGDPRVRASLNSQNRSEMEMDTNELMQFRIATKVVDIRPNGTLVLEGHRRIHNNSEAWEQRLTGLVAREEISPARTVQSEKIADLKIEKCESGHVRDGYRRGWFTKFFSYINPF